MSKLSYFNDTHEIFRTTIRKFVDAEILPNVDDWEEDGKVPSDLYKKSAELGLNSVGAPIEWGGIGEDVFMHVVLNEELIRGTSMGVITNICSSAIGLPPIWNWGSQFWKEKLIPSTLAGENIVCLAITEPNGGSDVANLRTRAVHDGDDYVINGAKMFITGGIRADYFNVAVRTGEPGHRGISLVLVKKGTPGFTIGKNLKKTGWWTSDTAELFFDDCRVPKENLIGQENKGFYYIMSNFQMERLTMAVQANSIAQLALDKALEYAQDRKMFGRTLSDFQVTRHKLAKMATAVSASREFTYRVAARMDNGEDCEMEVSMAKNQATQCSDWVTWEAVQIFGGHGFMRGTVVERLFRDNRNLSIGGGTYEIMNEIIAKQLLQ